MKKVTYLCSVRTIVTDYPGKFPARGKPSPTLPKLKRWRLTTTSIFLFPEFFPEFPNEIFLKSEAFPATLGSLLTHRARWLRNRLCTRDRPRRQDERCSPSKG